MDYHPDPLFYISRARGEDKTSTNIVYAKLAKSLKVHRSKSSQEFHKEILTDSKWNKVYILPY